ncbi:MAG: C39 family peptidase [Candidatus Eisenbacteria bacterium]
MRFGLLLLVGFLVPGVPGTASADPASDEAALRISRDLIDRVAASDLGRLVAVPDLSAARVEELFVVHDVPDGRPIYCLVPIRSGGEVVGVVAVDAEEERWLWYTFSYRDERFPPVSEGEARVRVADRARRLGAAGPEETGSIVRGRDKRLYWRFDSADDSWLVDVDRPGADVLGTVDGSAVRPLFAEPLLKADGRSMPPRGERALFPDDDVVALLRELPSAYNITGVPYHYQITDWYCGPASLQMVMDYVGEEISQYTIGDVADENPAEGTYDSDLVRAAHFSGMSVAIQDSSLQGYAERRLGLSCVWTAASPARRLRQLVARDCPALTLTWYDDSFLGGHFRVVKGYDNNLDVFIIHDPWFGSPYWGPDLLMNQTFFMDLWSYSGWTGFAASPWRLIPELPETVEEGDTFAVDLTVVYPGESPFDGQLACSTCVATINLPSGLSLLGGSAAQSLPDLASGDSAAVSWNVIVSGSSGDYDIAFQAQGIVRASSQAYPYPGYRDSIGGHALEAVAVGPSRPPGWGDELRLTSAEGSSCTSFPGGRAAAIEPDGTVHVVWADTRDGDSEIYYAARAGDVWQAETRLTNGAGVSDSPAIACDDSGRVHVAWTDTRDGDQEIYYKYKDQSGWSADERVTARPDPDRAPSIAAGAGGVFVAWEMYAGGYGTRVTEVAFSARTGGVWSAPTTPDASSVYESYRPCLARGADGPLHLVYERESSNVERPRIRYRSWNGSSWSGASVLSNDSSYSRGPVIAAGADSSLHVVWQDGENVPSDIFYALFDGLSWQPAEAIVAGAGEAATPSVAVDAGGVVWVAWADHRHGEPEIHVLNGNDARGWDGEIRVSRGDGTSSLPCIAAGGLGEVCAVWTDVRDGNSEIYFRSRFAIDTDVLIAASGPFIGSSVHLTAPYPAPFRSETRFLLALPEPAPVALRVFDLSGRHVRTLAEGSFGAGSHLLVWDGKNGSGRDVAPGVYFIRCETPRGGGARRIVRVR